MGKWFWSGKQEGDPPPVVAVPYSEALSKAAEWMPTYLGPIFHIDPNQDFVNYPAPKEPEMPRKIVIEASSKRVGWEPVFEDVTTAIHELGTSECPDVKRHLDRLIEVLNRSTKNIFTYRWRYAEPAGRPARRGDVLKTHSAYKYVLVRTDGPAHFELADVQRGGFIRCRYDEVFFHEDGAPVTGYDPS